MRGQAYALAILLVGAAVFGSPEVALGVTLFTGVASLLLYLRYKSDLRAANVKVVARHRERLDLILAGDLRTTLLVGLTASILLIALPVDRPTSDVPPGASILLAFTGSIVLLSSLVDWYVILPRVSGLLGIRPCRQPNTDFPHFPKTWRHPSLIIGRTVSRRGVERVPRVLTIFGLRLKLPLLSRRVMGPPHPRDYVYDVALEGVQLVPSVRREGEIPRDESGDVIYERNLGKLKVRNIDASRPEPADEPFHGCNGRCSGINWYCIENPRCFATK